MEWDRISLNASPAARDVCLFKICLPGSDALEDHEGTVSIGSRAITNLRFADDIDGLAGEEEELAKLVERFDKTSTAYAWRSVPRRPS